MKKAQSLLKKKTTIQKKVKPKISKKKTQNQDLALKKNKNFIIKKTTVNNQIQNIDTSIEKDKKILSNSSEKSKR